LRLPLISFFWTYPLRKIKSLTRDDIPLEHETYFQGDPTLGLTLADLAGNLSCAIVALMKALSTRRPSFQIGKRADQTKMKFIANDVFQLSLSYHLRNFSQQDKKNG
jgi:hypothetical protein